MALFKLGDFLADPNTGVLPKWFGRLRAGVFAAMRWSYLWFYRPVWGDGERTEGDRIVAVEQYMEDGGGKRRGGKMLLVEQVDVRDAVVQLEEDLGIPSKLKV